MGRWRGAERPPDFEVCCSCECHSPGSFLAAEGGQWPVWVTSGPGLSHHQRPGCPATRKGTKGTFDVQGPPLRCTEQQARTFQPLPHPRHPSSFRNSTRQLSKASPRDVSLLCGRGMAALCQREAKESVSLGILTSPLFLMALTHPGSCRGVKEM